MWKCVEKLLCDGVLALVSVSLFCSQTVESVENKSILKLNTTLQTTRNLDNLTQYEPRVLPVLKHCSGQHESFCINGLCSFHENINTPSCTCHSGFIGERCEILNLDFPVRSLFNLEEGISIICGVIVLLVCVCALSYCCYRKCGRKPTPPYKNQENSV